MNFSFEGIICEEHRINMFNFRCSLVFYDLIHEYCKLSKANVCPVPHIMNILKVTLK